MKYHQLLRYLDELGFIRERRTTHGCFYFNGKHRLMIPRKTKTQDPRAMRNLLRLIERKTVESKQT